MQQWLIENTNITKVEYEKIMNKEMINSFGIPTRNCILMGVIEKFTQMYRTSNLQNYFLARKMDILKTNEGWKYQNIHFQVLSDIYPQDSKILRSEQRNLVRNWIVYVLLRYFTQSMPDAKMVIARMHDLDGCIFLNSFVLAGNKVFDYHKNLIMDQDLYYQMYQVQEMKCMMKEEYESLHQEFIKNRNLLQLKINDVTFEEFLCWPEEINRSVLKLVKEKN